jgi:hypothetical protein
MSAPQSTLSYNNAICLRGEIMYKKRILLIRNPVSGKDSRHSQATILQELQLAGYEITEYETTANWDNNQSFFFSKAISAALCRALNSYIQLR